MAYIKDYADNNGGSTLSIKNALSDLRCHFTREGLSWLVSKDQVRVKRAVDLMCLIDTTESKQSEAITRGLLLECIRHMDLNDKADLEIATLCFLCHDGVLRAGELFSGLLVKDVRWSPNKKTIFLRLWRTKTHRSGNSIEIEIVDPGEDCICAVSLLRRWFTKMELWGQFECPAFPKVTRFPRGGFKAVDKSKHLSRRAWSVRYKHFLSIVGLNPVHYTDHGFRAGGATDLFDAGMTLVNVMEFGRWKSATSCLRYYRKGNKLGSRVARAFIVSVTRH